MLCPSRNTPQNPPGSIRNTPPVQGLPDRTSPSPNLPPAGDFGDRCWAIWDQGLAFSFSLHQSPDGDLGIRRRALLRLQARPMVELGPMEIRPRSPLLVLAWLRLPSPPKSKNPSPLAPISKPETLVLKPLVLSQISAWRSRGCLPVPIDVTAAIVEIQQKDPYFR